MREADCTTIAVAAARHTQVTEPGRDQINAKIERAM